MELNKRSPVVLTTSSMFSIVGLIYFYYWVYVTIEGFKKINEENEIPGSRITIILSLVILRLAFLYWLIKVNKTINESYAKRRISPPTKCSNFVHFLWLQ